MAVTLIGRTPSGLRQSGSGLPRDLLSREATPLISPARKCGVKPTRTEPSPAGTAPKPHTLSPNPCSLLSRLKLINPMPRQSTHETKSSPEKSPRREPTASGQRDAAVNRIASHNYFLLEKFECG